MSLARSGVAASARVPLTTSFRSTRVRMQDLPAAEREQLLGQARPRARRERDLARGRLAVRIVRAACVASIDRRVARDHRQQIVEVVRDAAGERADRLELLRLVQLLLELLALGDLLRSARGRRRSRPSRRPSARPSRGRRCRGSPSRTSCSCPRAPRGSSARPPPPPPARAPPRSCVPRAARAAGRPRRSFVPSART